MNYKITYSDDYLAHHGILGQKWGVRRYRNEDGSLTEAGKIRYSVSNKVYEHGRKLATQKFRAGGKKKDYGHSNLSTFQSFGRVASDAGLRSVVISAGAFATRLAIAKYGKQPLGKKIALMNRVENVGDFAHRINSAWWAYDLGSVMAYNYKNSRSGETENSNVGDSSRMTLRRASYGKRINGPVRDSLRDLRTYNESQRRKYDLDKAKAKYEKILKKYDGQNTPEVEKAKRRYEEVVRKMQKDRYRGKGNRWHTLSGVLEVL